MTAFLETVEASENEMRSTVDDGAAKLHCAALDSATSAVYFLLESISAALSECLPISRSSSRQWKTIKHATTSHINVDSLSYFYTAVGG